MNYISNDHNDIVNYHLNDAIIQYDTWLVNYWIEKQSEAGYYGGGGEWYDPLGIMLSEFIEFIETEFIYDIDCTFDHIFMPAYYLDNIEVMNREKIYLNTLCDAFDNVMHDDMFKWTERKFYDAIINTGKNCTPDDIDFDKYFIGIDFVN